MSPDCSSCINLGHHFGQAAYSSPSQRCQACLFPCPRAEQTAPQQDLCGIIRAAYYIGIARAPATIEYHTYLSTLAIQ